MAKKQEKKPESHICYLCDKSIEPDEKYDSCGVHEEGDTEK